MINRIKSFVQQLLIYTVFVFPGRFIYETERHNGVAELLEILGRYS